MRNGPVFFKSILSLAIVAFLTVFIFSSCTHTSTSTSAYVGDWAQKAEFQGNPRTQAVSFTIHYPSGDTVYIGEGFNGVTGVRYNDFYKYDESKDAWLPIANFPGTPKNASAGFSVNGKGYVVGGYDGTYYYNDVWEYDPTTNTWAAKNPAPFTTRYGAVGFSVNVGSTPYGYIAGGFDSSGAWKGDTWQYNDVSDSWTPGGDLKRKCTGAAVFVYNNTAYVVGGINNGSYIPDLQVYDQVNQIWNTNRPVTNENDSSYDALYGFNIVRSNTAAFLINDTAYLATGNYNSIIGTCWGYDIKADQWFQKTTFEGPAREGAIGFTVNNHGYVATGDNNSTYYDDVWQFYPDAAQTNADN